MSDSTIPLSARRNIFLAGGLIALAAFAAYHNSFSVPFIFDDRVSIAENPTIRRLWPAWATAPGTGTEGRPLLNFSYALNYALGGLKIGGYHALNWIIHFCAGLTLFGIVRRTLLRPMLRERFAAAALPLALAAAVLWTVHPLQTASVTYLSQRAESLMGLCYLLTLYCFIRGVDSASPRNWQVLAVATCLLGMATKEVMITAPLMVVLYDRTFVAGEGRTAWRQRRGLYLGLAATWVLLAGLMAGLLSRHVGVGYGEGVSGWTYALTECRAVVQYLGLAVWPHPLVFDHGPAMITSVAKAAPYAIVLIALLVGTVVALRRWPALGFLGCWFFVILAPTSSVVPVALQPMAENRLYLSLAAVVVLAVVGAYRWLGRKSLVVFAALAVGGIFLTANRNQDYRTELALWTDTVAKEPDNVRAEQNLGNALVEAGRVAEAVPHYERALQILPTSYGAHDSLGSALCELGRTAEGIAHFEAALKLKPDFAQADNDLGRALLQTNRPTEAVAHFEAALRSNPNLLDAHINLGVALAQMGHGSEAMQHFEQAKRLRPDAAEVYYNLAGVLAQQGQTVEAIAQYATALRMKPDYAEAEVRVGDIFYRMGRLTEAVAHYQAAVRLRSGFPEACHKLGLTLLESGRGAEAIEFFQGALRSRPDQAEAQDDLGTALVQAGKVGNAISAYEEAVKLNPAYADGHFDLGVALVQMKQFPAAITQFEAVVQLTPANAEAHYNLGFALKQVERNAEARKEFEEALRLKPDYSAARENLDRLRGL